MMNSYRLAALAALGLGLVACADNPNVQPPIAGTTTATAGAQAARIATDAIPQSQREATSTGVTGFGGTTGGGDRPGRPTVIRDAPGQGTVGGGIPQQFRPSITDRPRGG